MKKIFGYTFAVLLALVGIALFLGFLIFPSLSVNRMNVAKASYTVTFDDGTVETGEFMPFVRVRNQSQAGQCAEPFDGTLLFSHSVQTPLISVEMRTQSQTGDAPSFVSVVLGTGDDILRFTGRGNASADSNVEISRGPLRWHYTGRITQDIAKSDESLSGEITVIFEGRAQATYGSSGNISFPNFCWGTHR